MYGLVLAGGASRRMQSDKAQLDYHGRPQLEWTLDLLKPLCERVFVSLRRACEHDLPPGIGAILDDGDYQGPAAGILSAQRAHADVAWSTHTRAKNNGDAQGESPCRVVSSCHRRKLPSVGSSSADHLGPSTSPPRLVLSQSCRKHKGRSEPRATPGGVGPGPLPGG